MQVYIQTAHGITIIRGDASIKDQIISAQQGTDVSCHMNVVYDTNSHCIYIGFRLHGNDFVCRAGIIHGSLSAVQIKEHFPILYTCLERSLSAQCDTSLS